MPDFSRTFLFRQSAMKFVLHCDAENLFSLNIEGEERPHQFKTLLSALAFAHEVIEEGEYPFTVVDPNGRIIEESVIGATW
jgi:hypothetical protein